MDNYIFQQQQQLNYLAELQGIELSKVMIVVEKFGYETMFNVLQTYGYSMLGVLVVKAEKDLPIDFAKEVTPADGNCYLHALQNQSFENMSVIPQLTFEHVHELNISLQKNDMKAPC